MALSPEHVEPKILADIKVYILTRAELLCSLCFEIPCKYLIWAISAKSFIFWQFVQHFAVKITRVVMKYILNSKTSRKIGTAKGHRLELSWLTYLKTMA
jgi:hypothetical protein